MKNYLRLFTGLLVMIWGSSALAASVWQHDWQYVCGNGQTTGSPTYCEKHGGYICEDGSHPRHLSSCHNRGGPRHKTPDEMYLCSNRSTTSRTDGCNGADYRCMKNNKRKHKLVRCRDYGGPVFRSKLNSDRICGNGIKEPSEQCDNGSDNSDVAPDSCRSDCRLPHCGDRVKDSGEQCDEGSRVNVENHCRTDCKLPVCGDGIVDDQFKEQCDDGNKNETDGCRNDCKICLKVNTNHNITADTLLCRNTYSANDFGDEGVLILKYPNIVLDCNGATLRGDGRGTGIMVLRADNVKIQNCNVTGFENGIKVIGSRGVVISGGRNPVYGNQHGVVSENSDVKVQSLTMPQGMVPDASRHSAIMKQSKTRYKQTNKTATSFVPVIQYPRAGQHFNGPATIAVRLRSHTRERVIYTLSSLPKRVVRARSNSGMFRNVQPGEYCVTAAWAKTPNNTGSCVMFTVTGNKARAAEPHHSGAYQVPAKPVPHITVPKFKAVQ